MTNEFKRNFEYKNEKSSKFWEITLLDGTVRVNFGKTGTNGQSQEKVFNNAAAALKYADRLIFEKTKKGYFEIQEDLNGSRMSIDANNNIEAEASKKTVQSKIKNSKTKVPVSMDPARDPEADPESLKKLIDRDVFTNRLLAKHPMANPSLLEQLSHSSDKSTRKLVCVNPKVGKDVLLRLAPQFPREFFKNPCFDWLLIEDPNIIFKIGQGVLKNILKQADCPQSFLQWATHHGSEEEMLAVAMNPNSSHELIEILLKKSKIVAEAAKGRFQDEDSIVDLNKAFKTEIVNSLDDLEGVKDKHLDLLYENELIDVNHVTFLKTMKWLSKGEINKIKKNLIKVFANLVDLHKDRIDSKIVNIFCRSKSRGLCLIGLADDRADLEILIKQSKSIDWVARLAISRNSSTPINILIALSKDVNGTVACQARKTLQIKEEIKSRQNSILTTENDILNLQPIINEICKEIRGYSWATPLAGTRWWSLVPIRDKIGYASPFGQFAAEQNEKIKSFLINSPFNIDLLVNSSNVWVRSVSCESPNILPEHLIKLAKDESWFVRSQVAINPKISDSTLNQLLKDENSAVRAEAIQNQNLPMEMLENFAINNDDNIRRAVARNINLSSELISKLCKDDDFRVRGSIASNIATPIEILGILAGDKKSYVRENLAKNIKTPNSVMDILANDKNEEVRTCVAANSRIPLSLLKLLAADKKEAVRGSVAKNISATGSMLVDLSMDEKFSVKIGVLLNSNTKFEIIENMIADLNIINKISSDDMYSYCSYIKMLSNFKLRIKAEDPSSSELNLLEMSKVGLWSIRLVAIQNPNFPSKIRDKALQDLWSEMNSDIAKTDDPSPPSNVEISEISVALTSIRCLQRYETNKGIMEAARSDDLIEKTAAILAPNVQPSVLRMLLEDVNPSVRQLAAFKLRRE